MFGIQQNYFKFITRTKAGTTHKFRQLVTLSRWHFHRCPSIGAILQWMITRLCTIQLSSFTAIKVYRSYNITPYWGVGSYQKVITVKHTELSKQYTSSYMHVVYSSYQLNPIITQYFRIPCLLIMTEEDIPEVKLYKLKNIFDFTCWSGVVEECGDGDKRP